MAINENWNIRSRSHVCAHTGEAFTDGETFYTALFDDPVSEELVRRDYSVASWDTVRREQKPFSFWKSIYEAPRSEAKVEVVEKETAEGLLRRLIEEDAPGTENTRYILAVMLERKKILKHTATRETEDANFLVYEHPKSGEVYIIRDPELRLDQVEAVQREVSILLAHGTRTPTSAEEAPAPAGEETPAPSADSESTPAPETADEPAATTADPETAPPSEDTPEPAAEPSPPPSDSIPDETTEAPH